MLDNRIFFIGRAQFIMMILGRQTIELMQYWCSLKLMVTYKRWWCFSCIIVLDMKIVQAFPCRCRFADKENAPKVQEEVWISLSA